MTTHPIAALEPCHVTRAKVKFFSKLAGVYLAGLKQWERSAIRKTFERK